MPGSLSILDRAPATQMDNLIKLTESLNKQSKRLNCLTITLLILTVILALVTVIDIAIRLNT